MADPAPGGHGVPMWFRSHPLVRALVGASLLVTGLPASAWLGFVGAVGLTGCFIKCTSDPEAIGLLWLGTAVAAFGAAVAAMVWGFGASRRVIRRAFVVAAVIASVLAVIGTAGFG